MYNMWIPPPKTSNPVLFRILLAEPYLNAIGYTLW